MSRRKETSLLKKFAPVAITAALVVGVATINACTPSDRSTEGREESMSQNAAEAEAAEAQLAAVPEKGHGKSDSKAVAKADKKASKTVAKKDDHKATKDAHGDLHGAGAKTTVAKNEKTDAKADKHDAHATVAAVKVPTVTKSMGRHVASAGGVFVVQVGAFKVKENAEKLQAKLKQAGYTVEMTSIEHSKNGLLHLVRTQAVPSKAEAETVVEDLHAKHDLTAQVVTVPATH